MLLDHFPVSTRLGGQDEEFLSIGGLVRQADGLVQMLKEFLGGGSVGGPIQLGCRKIRIQRYGVVIVLQGVLPEQPLGEVASLQKLLARILGLCGDGNLALGRRFFVAARLVAGERG